jgi:N-formylglutamate amidohydrolase
MDAADTPVRVKILASIWTCPTLTHKRERFSYPPMKRLDGDDSHYREGGEVPGSGGVAAFALSGPLPSVIPVLIAVPHAGRAYPDPLLASMRNPGFAALRLEDRYVDTLGEAVARETGATLLRARAPRAMIDLNRAPDDVDWEMFGGRPSGDVGSYTPGRRARSGLGLIPRRLPGIGELWKRRHDTAELAQRIAQIHEPYHACLAESLEELRRRWGAALLVDLHSMPPLAPRGHQPGAEFVLGDRFGASCHGRLVGAAFTFFEENGRGAAHNRPYAGGYVLERHGAPARGTHALQLEIDRGSYLDGRLVEPGEGYAAMVTLLAGLIRRLAAEVALLGGSNAGEAWAEAAE